MKDNYETLEFNIIKNRIKHYSSSSLAIQKIENMSIFKDKEDLELELSKVEEAMKCIDYYGKLHLGGFVDISTLLNKARIDAVLNGEELYHIFNHLECIKSIIDYYRNIEFDIIYLKDIFEGVMFNQSLYLQIQKCIMPDGSISDHASSTLYHIRKEMNNIQLRVRKTMESLVKGSKDSLSIDTLTMRNDRLVLPVKASYKNQFGGIVHAHSATGQTLYIEPEAVMGMNNQFNDLKIKEQEEIYRILTSLTVMVNDFTIQFQYNQQFLTDLDFVFSKALFGVEYHCQKPLINDNYQTMYLSEARHPLIDQKKVVSNTIRIDQQKMLLITGSNTGGKSVLLKTVGLLSLMALTGMVIPIHEANIPFFDNIFIDLGDEQSIEQSLSTFSSHMNRIASILKESTSQSLIILDEIGSGTDPDEGESLAQAILEELLKIDCYTFASTHYGHLKSFAKLDDRIAIGSVSFDVETLRPTYHLQMDLVGQSYALEIISHLGFKEDLIQRAKTIKKEKMSEAEILLEKLEKEKEVILHKEKKLNDLMYENEELNQKYTKLIEKIKKQKERLLKEAKEEANLIIESAREDIDKIVKELKNSTLKDHQITDAKHQLKEMKYQDEIPLKKQDHQLKKGDHVKIVKMNREGDILEILKKNMIMVDIGGLSVKLHEDEVMYLHPQTKIKKVETSKRSIKMSKTSSYELNVIGKRYEEAMSIVDKFLDDAIVQGYPHVRIVHGMGTGVLRKGIRKMLEKNKNVVSYRDGGPNEGGLGATLVYFEK